MVAALVAPAVAQTRRALLVGIDKYVPGGASARVPGTRGALINLHGPINDVTALAQVLESRYGFAAANVHILTDARATRAGIIRAIRSDLIDPARRGDVCLFAFAGHGSNRYNSLSTKPGHWDQAIVPSDVLRGAAVIRDDTLDRLFKQVVAKGAVFTAFFDSCYSGAITRGLRKGGVARFAFYDLSDAHKAHTARPVTSEGGVVLSAANYDQAADEDAPGPGVTVHGHFSECLIQALLTLPANATGDQVIELTRDLMRARGWGGQHPVLEGPGSRPLFGPDARVGGPLTVEVVSTDVRTGTVVLSGGSALGFGRGSTFVRVGGGPPAELRVTSVDSLTQSTAKVVAGADVALHAGDLFAIRRWAMPPGQGLRVWLPPPISSAGLAHILLALRRLPGRVPPRSIAAPRPGAAKILEWDGAQWRLAGPAGASRDLGPRPTARQILAALGSTGSFLLADLPPTTALRGALMAQVSASNDTLVQLAPGAAAEYYLVGRTVRGNADYAWMRPSRFGMIGEPGPIGACSPDSPLPARSRWFQGAGALAAARGLRAAALRLGRIVALQSLAPPAGRDAFPYRLALQNLATGEDLRGGAARGGEEYSLLLRLANSFAGGGVPRRWIYVFTTDCGGRGQLLFPNADEGNVFNHLPSHRAEAGGSVLAQIPLGTAFQVAPPYGEDTFFLLTSEQPIEDLDVFNFGPVFPARRAASRGATSPLTELFGRLSSAELRGPAPAVSSQWSLERLHVRSEPPRAGAAANGGSR